MLNNSDESEQFYFVLGLTSKAFGFTLLPMMLALSGFNYVKESDFYLYFLVSFF